MISQPGFNWIAKSTRKVNPFAATDPRRKIPNLIHQHIVSEPAIQRTIIEMVGVQEINLQFGKSANHRCQRLTKLVILECLGHRHLNTDLLELFEIRRQCGEFEIVHERPVASVLDTTLHNRRRMQTIDRTFTRISLALEDPIPFRRIEHEFISALLFAL